MPSQNLIWHWILRRNWEWKWSRFFHIIWISIVFYSGQKVSYSIPVLPNRYFSSSGTFVFHRDNLPYWKEKHTFKKKHDFTEKRDFSKRKILFLPQMLSTRYMYHHTWRTKTTSQRKGFQNTDALHHRLVTCYFSELTFWHVFKML